MPSSSTSRSPPRTLSRDAIERRALRRAAARRSSPAIASICAARCAGGSASGASIADSRPDSETNTGDRPARAGSTPPRRALAQRPRRSIAPSASRALRRDRHRELVGAEQSAACASSMPGRRPVDADVHRWRRGQTRDRPRLAKRAPRPVSPLATPSVAAGSRIGDRGRLRIRTRSPHPRFARMVGERAEHQRAAPSRAPSRRSPTPCRASSIVVPQAREPGRPRRPRDASLVFIDRLPDPPSSLRLPQRFTIRASRPRWSSTRPTTVSTRSRSVFGLAVERRHRGHRRSRRPRERREHVLEVDPRVRRLARHEHERATLLEHHVGRAREQVVRDAVRDARDLDIEHGTIAIACHPALPLANGAL